MTQVEAQLRMTNAFYFGPADKPLFGTYHEPSLGREKQSGVVLCYPFGQEYVRSHRSYQKLATQLSQSGFHVLRFDYYGSGDSSGDSDAGTMRQWEGDIMAAILELQDSADIEQVSLVGLRLGATLAARLGARETGNRIKNVVLWEPVISGSEYIAELLRDHRDWFNDLSPKPPTDQVSRAGTEILGFPLTDQLRGEIEKIDLMSLENQRVSRALLLGTGDQASLGELNGHLRNLGVDCEYQSVAAPKVWIKQIGMDPALVPNDSLRCIASWIEKVHP